MQMSVHARAQQGGHRHSTLRQHQAPEHRANAVAPLSWPQRSTMHLPGMADDDAWQYLQAVNRNQHQFPLLGRSTIKVPPRAALPTKWLITHFLQDSNQQLTSTRNNILPCSRQGQIHCATPGDRDQLALGALLAPWAAQYIFCRQKML